MGHKIFYAFILGYFTGLVAGIVLTVLCTSSKISSLEEKALYWKSMYRRMKGR